MISHEHKCIFVHIPKTGGSSVEKVIWPLEQDKVEENLFGGFVEKNRNKYQTGGLQHLLARQIRSEVGTDIFERYYKFAFVRNPWDKTVSQYLFTKRKKFLLKYLNVKANVSFKDYLKVVRQCSHVQWEPQVNFLLDTNQSLLVDEIFRFENFEEDLTKAIQKLGLVHLIATNDGIPHEKKSTREHYSTYYCEETKRAVHEMYRKDIEYFGYKFLEQSH